MYTSDKIRRKGILLLAAVILLAGFSGCKKNTEDPPESTATHLPTSVPVQTTQVTEAILGTVTAEELNVREGVGINYEIVGKLYEGDEVEILEQHDLNGVPWGRTENGWICLIYVHLNGEPLHDPEATDAYDLTEPISGIVIAREVNVRTGPSTNYPVTTSLKKDDPVTIQEMNGIWGKTEDGWVSTIFVYFPDSIDSETISAMVTVDKLNVRTGPSTEYESLYKLNTDDKVEILKQVSIRGTQWGYISDGWICLDYVEFD